MPKPGRNKTIDTALEEGAEYLTRCLRPASLRAGAPILDSTINGDMLEVCALLPWQCADLIIADPPYNLTKSYDGTLFSKKKADEYEAYTRAWLAAVKPLMKDTASIYVCCDWESSLIIGRAMQDMFTVRSRITWQREKGRGAKKNWKNGMEDIWFATPGEEYTFNLDAVKIRRRVVAPYLMDGKPKDWTESAGGKYRDTCPSNFWDDITVPFWSMPENTAHPAQKPEKLLAKLILASSNAGDTVFDPFLGSGSVSVAAKKLGRHYIGVEIEPRYCVWAEQRLERADTDRRIQGMSGGVFTERNFRY